MATIDGCLVLQEVYCSEHSGIPLLFDEWLAGKTALLLSSRQFDASRNKIPYEYMFLFGNLCISGGDTNLLEN